MRIEKRFGLFWPFSFLVQKCTIKFFKIDGVLAPGASTHNIFLNKKNLANLTALRSNVVRFVVNLVWRGCVICFGVVR